MERMMNRKLAISLAAATLLAGASTASLAAGEGSTPGTTAVSTHSHTMSKARHARLHSHLMNRAHVKKVGGAPSAEGVGTSAPR